MNVKLKIFFLSIFCTTITAQTVTIKGHIHDRKRDEPLSFCNIIIQELKYTTASDIDGNFKFENVPLGTYKIKAIYFGYGDTIVEISITNKTTYELKMELPPPCKYDKNFKNKICPICKKEDQSIPIQYGLIISEKGSENDVYEKYYPGGCSISKCDPNWYCKRDKIKF